MKTFKSTFSLMYLLGISTLAWSQSGFKIISTGNGQEYDDGAILVIPCGSGNNSFDIVPRYNNGSAYVNMNNVSASAVSTIPTGYTASNPNNDISELHINFTNPQNGDLVFTAYYGSYGHTFTYHLQSNPIVAATSTSIPTLQANQSGTSTVQITDQPTGGTGVAITYSPNPYTSLNWSTTFGARVNGGTSYSSGNTGNTNSQTISTTGSGGVVYVNASNVCGVSPTISFPVGPPYINPGPLLLVDSYSNVWQFTQTTQPNTTYSFYLAAGLATLTPNYGDCYVQTSGGAAVCVTGTNSNGTSDPYCFNVPAGGGYMRAVSPNPANDHLSLQFNDTKSLETLPSTIYLFAENSTKAVRSIAMKDVYERNAFEDGDKVNVPVGDLPRGIYYLHVIPNQESKQPTQQIRIILE